jgi:ABC-type transport system involved in Fe-S cluster assembly fused permease/ATPase subunit
LLEGRTAIVIAHRLATVLAADKIIVLEKGKIIKKLYETHFGIYGSTGKN